VAITVSVLTGGTNSHQTTSEEINFGATDFFSDGVVGSHGNTGGVAPATGAFAANAQGTPDTTVAVSSGVAYVTGTPSGGNSQRFRVKNSATSNVTIAANATGGTRYDWLYLKIDPTKLANPAVDASDVATLVTSRSTSLTTDNGTPPTYGLLLAIVTVANGFSTITNGNITDSRAQTGATSTTYTNYFALYNFIESGCIWSGDSYGSTLAGSMTSGVVWIGGSRLTVAAVTARAFTLSKDTYVDLKDAGNGTASINYTEVANNAASPALYSSGTTADTVRVGIIVSGVASIAAVGSVNQGQENKVLPIASSIPYSVSDSLGNLICPRDPSSKLLGYRQRLTDFAPGTTAETLITGLNCPVIIPTGRKVKVTLYSYSFPATTTPVARLYSGVFGSGGTQIQQENNASAGPVNSTAITTPSSASTTFTATTGSVAGNPTFSATSTAPSFLKVELE
jgi:hypothetical protein